MQKALGTEYRVAYDAVDSGMTEIYYGGDLIKVVPNGEMNGSLNVAEYTFGWYLANRH